MTSRVRNGTTASRMRRRSPSASSSRRSPRERIGAMRFGWMRLRRDQRGTALIEMAFTLPLLMLISVGIIEFGRAFQTWQIVTNAAREGARVAVLPGYSDSMVTSRVQQYIQVGVLGPATPTVAIQRNVSVSYGTGTATGSKV